MLNHSALRIEKKHNPLVFMKHLLYTNPHTENTTEMREGERILPPSLEGVKEDFWEEEISKLTPEFNSHP